MTRVLIASDGSPSAIEAGRRALAIVGTAADVTVLTVVDLRPQLATGATGLIGGEPLVTAVSDPDVTAELDDVLTHEAEDVLERTCQALGVAAERLVTHGDPASEICRVAGEDGYDLVVVGSHGSGLVKRILMGSVSNHVVHHAPVPVLVVREHAEDD